MADISKVGIISVEGIKIVDRINAVEPLTPASAITDATYPTYSNESSPNELFALICEVFKDKLNELKAKLKTAGIMETSGEGDAKTEISKVGIITPEGIRILDKLNISIPTATVDALIPSVVTDYATDLYPIQGTGFIAGFSDLVWDFNQLLIKLREAGYLGTELNKDGIITVEGAKIYNRLQNKFELFCAENHANLTGMYYINRPSFPYSKDFYPSTFTEAYNGMADSVDYLNELLLKLRASGIITE